MLPNAKSSRWRLRAARRMSCCLLLLALLRCEAQNLVPNHSFEERDSCLEVNMAYTLGTGPLGRFTAVAGNFLADDEASYTRGVLGYARGGDFRYGVEGRADAGMVANQDWGTATEITGVRGFADAGGDAATAYGVYGEATGATTNGRGISVGT